MMRFGWIEEPPFNFRGADGVVAGCDVDLARAICILRGWSFEPIETTFVELLPGLAAGRWEMTTGMFITPARRALAQFSRPIWALADGLLVLAEAAQHVDCYQSIVQLGGKLAVLRGQVQHDTALAAGMTPAQILLLDSYDQGVEAVRSGAAMAYASVAAAHRTHVQRHPDQGLAVVDVSGAEKPAHIGAFALQDKGLCAEVDAALTVIFQSKTHRRMMNSLGIDVPE
jgi:polar amino acid transport system substrate-binding protein